MKTLFAASFLALFLVACGENNTPNTFNHEQASSELDNTLLATSSAQAVNWYPTAAGQDLWNQSSTNSMIAFRFKTSDLDPRITNPGKFVVVNGYFPTEGGPITGVWAQYTRDGTFQTSGMVVASSSSMTAWTGNQRQMTLVLVNWFGMLAYRFVPTYNGVTYYLAQYYSDVFWRGFLYTGIAFTAGERSGTITYPYPLLCTDQAPCPPPDFHDPRDRN